MQHMEIAQAGPQKGLAVKRFGGILMRKLWRGSPDTGNQGKLSDRQLVYQLGSGNPAALAALYDRYAPLVFTLAHHADPLAAEAITEEVFVAVWHAGRRRSLALPLLEPLIDLTAARITRRRLKQGHTAVSAHEQPLLATLAPFAALCPPLFDIAVLSFLGQLKVAELAVALEMEPQVIAMHLTAAFLEMRTVLESPKSLDRRNAVAAPSFS
jgi:DNA-directed RNA polymerase specialized sigma24 family protein